MAQVQSKSNTHMAIATQDLEYIKSQVFVWINEAGLISNSNQLTERIVRVEESLKNQMHLMQQGFQQNDKQIQLLREDMNHRFEQVDKRFEQVEQQIQLQRDEFNKRFEQVDKRFEQVDKRFEQVDKRFEQVDKRFDKMFTNFRWTVGALIAFWGVTLGTIQFMLSSL